MPFVFLKGFSSETSSIMFHNGVRLNQITHNSRGSSEEDVREQQRPTATRENGKGQINKMNQCELRLCTASRCILAVKCGTFYEFRDEEHGGCAKKSTAKV